MKPQPGTIWINKLNKRKYKVITCVTMTKCGKFPDQWANSPRVVYTALTNIDDEVYERYLSNFLEKFEHDELDAERVTNV